MEAAYHARDARAPQRYMMQYRPLPYRSLIKSTLNDLLEY